MSWVYMCACRRIGCWCFLWWKGMGCGDVVPNLGGAFFEIPPRRGGPWLSGSEARVATLLCHDAGLLVLSEWVGKKTQDLQSICPKESGNINTTGTFTTIYTTGSFCWFVFPRPMHVQSLSLSLLRMHMSYVFSPKPLHNEPCGKQWLSIVSWLEHE
jgi:hypothetical protein